MGILDDAIREHLDLKRRRGADPAEIERAEREALGPVRRSPIGSEEPPWEHHLDGGADESLAPGHAEPPPLTLEEPGYGRAVEEFDEPFSDEDHYHVEHEVEPGPSSESNLAFEPLNDRLEAPTDIHVPRPIASDAVEDRAPVSAEGEDLDELGETVEYVVEPARQAPSAEPPERGEDDVLEETPDFLQDAPEHDRLWFEQKPPRDFDFEA